jgi:hypothetical protein
MGFSPDGPPGFPPMNKGVYVFSFCQVRPRAGGVSEVPRSVRGLVKTTERPDIRHLVQTKSENAGSGLKRCGCGEKSRVGLAAGKQGRAVPAQWFRGGVEGSARARAAGPEKRPGGRFQGRPGARGLPPAARQRHLRCQAGFQPPGRESRRASRSPVVTARGRTSKQGQTRGENWRPRGRRRGLRCRPPGSKAAFPPGGESTTAIKPQRSVGKTSCLCALTFTTPGIAPDPCSARAPRGRASSRATAPPAAKARSGPHPRRAGR